MSNSDKLIIVLLTIAGVLIILGGSYITYEKFYVKADDTGDTNKADDTTNEEEKTDDAVLEEEKTDDEKLITVDEVGYTSITIADYLTLMQEDTIHIFSVTSPTCSACIMFEPTIQTAIVDHNLAINQINIDNETDEAFQALISSSTKLADIGTPTIIITKNNEVTYVNEGSVSEETLITFFQDSGIIKVNE